MLHSILSLIAYCIVLVLCFTVDKIHTDWKLFLILSISIFFNVIGIPWFYQAIEEFKYITLRSLIIRCISLISLFLFVKSSSDLYLYALILIGGQVGNFGLNFYRLRKYHVFRNVKVGDLSLKRHLHASVRIFILNVAISLYININPIMLGFMTNAACVGYYTAVTRIINVANGITTSIGAVILPRLSNYYATGKWTSYNLLKNKTLDLINLICLPISCCLIAISPIFIPLFAGDAYYPSINTLIISAPTLLISALNYIIAIQILYTQNKENSVIFATISGGCLNVILNVILIPHLQQNGTAISGLLAELTVLVVCLILGHKNINYNFFNKNNLQAIGLSVVCGCLCWFINKIELPKISLIIIDIIAVFIFYTVSLLLLRNNIIIEYKIILLNRIRNL